MNRCRFINSLIIFILVCFHIACARLNNDNINILMDDVFSYDMETVLDHNPQKPESLLYGPSMVATDSDTNYHVLDSPGRQVVVFDKNGQYSRSYGRFGNGPGEFNFPGTIRITGDLVTILDIGAPKVIVYTVSGVYVRTIPLHHFTYQAHITSRGDLVAETRAHISIDNIRYQQRILTIYNESKTINIAAPKTNYEYHPTNSRGYYYQPFGAISSFYIDHTRGILLSPGNQTELIWYEYDGREKNRIRVPMEPEPVTKNDINIYNQYLDSFKDKHPDGVEAKVRTSYKMPQYKPYWGEVFIDDLGYYWLKRITLAHEPLATTGPKTYIVLDPNGKMIGTTTVKASISNCVEKGRMIVIRTDTETKEILIEVYRIKSNHGSVRYP